MLCKLNNCFVHRNSNIFSDRYVALKKIFLYLTMERGPMGPIDAFVFRI